LHVFDRHTLARLIAVDVVSAVFAAELGWGIPWNYKPAHQQQQQEQQQQQQQVEGRLCPPAASGKQQAMQQVAAAASGTR
jgi:stringent starvation protein B